MIKQLILFKFKNQISQEIIDEFIENYKKLESSTPLLSIEIGKNISKENFDKGFLYGAIASFSDQNAVSEFLNHPDHIDLVDRVLDPILEDIVILEIKV